MAKTLKPGLRGVDMIRLRFGNVGRYLVVAAALLITACQSQPDPAKPENRDEPVGQNATRKERRSVSVDGCVTIDQVLVLADGREVKDGPSRSWYDNGKKLREGNFEKGEKQGVWRYWRRDGGLRSLETYRDGKYDGVILVWDEETNDLLEAEIMVQGIPESVSITFHRSNIPSIIQTYKREVGLTGVRLSFHEFGMPARLAEYKDDKLNGKSVEWDEDGTRTKVETYKDGVKEK